MKHHLRHLLPLARSWTAYAALPAAGLLTAPLLALALGPIGRGQLTGMLQPMVLAAAVAALGVPSAVTYFIGKGVDPKRVSKIAIRISIVVTVIVFTGLLLYSETVSLQLGIDRTEILCIWLALLPSAFVGIRRARLQGLRRYRQLDLERALGAIFRIAAIILLYVAGVSDVVVYAAAYMAAGLAASAVLRLPPSEFKNEASIDRSKLQGAELLRYALLASLGTIAATMSSRLDQAIMPVIVPPAELGFFAVAVAVAEIPMIITMVAVRNVMTEASRDFAWRTILRSVLIGAAGQLVLIGALLAATPYIFPIVFGGDFGPAMKLVPVLLVGAFLTYWTAVASSFLAGKGRPGLASLGPAAGAASTAVLFWIQWHRMSAVVAAWISVASQSASCATGAMLIVAIAIQRRAFTRSSSAAVP